MELKEYIAIFRQQAKVFWMTAGVIIFLVIVWQQNQSVRYQATLLLNIGREGVQQTEQYTYDHFYRLQADERFADTVVRWFGSPRVVEDIYDATGLRVSDDNARDMEHIFVAKRLSSQMIEVTYTDSDTKTLKKIAEASVIVLNRYTKSLNENTMEQGWFVVLGSDPVTRDMRVSFVLAVIVGCGVGIFVGFWLALFSHYIRNEK